MGNSHIGNKVYYKSYYINYDMASYERYDKGYHKGCYYANPETLNLKP